MPLTWLTVLNVEPYLFSFGLVLSVLACGISRSRSRSRRPLTAQDHQSFNPLQLTKHSIGDLNSLSTIELQARVLMTKACDKEISVEEFYKYFTFTNLPFFCPKQLDKSKPYKLLCLFGPPGIGKSSAAEGINKFIQGEKVTTTSKKFYKYVNEATNTNLYHYTNDSFATATNIQWDKLLQSLYSIQHSAGRHFIIAEGHRLFECEDLLDMADYIIVLTATSATLQARPDPRPPLSLQLYQERISPHLEAINKSKGILKINAISSPETIVKKIGAFVALKNQGFKEAGRRLSDTPSLLEVSQSTT